jgi:hypothetical protein
MFVNMYNKLAYLNPYTENPYYVVCCGCLAAGARAHAIWAGPIPHHGGEGSQSQGPRCGNPWQPHQCFVFFDPN